MGKAIKAGTTTDNLPGEIRWENNLKWSLSRLRSRSVMVYSRCSSLSNFTEDIKAVSGVDTVLPAIVYVRLVYCC